MTEEEKYRVEHPDNGKRSDYGLAKSLPQSQEPAVLKQRDAPIVTFLGLSMRESRRDWIHLVLIPLLGAIIECTILAYQIVFFEEVNAIIFLLICFVISLPIGILQPTSDRSLTAGIFSSVFLCLFSMLFMVSPALFAPFVVPLDEFLLMSMVFMLGYFALSLPSCILGSYIGHIIREIL